MDDKGAESSRNKGAMCEGGKDVSVFLLEAILL